MSNILKSLNTKQVTTILKKKLNYKNQLMTPVLKAAHISVGLSRNEKADLAFDKIFAIANQKPVKRATRKSVSDYGIREGMITGVSVTLRRQNMFDLVHKLSNYILPQIASFRGLSRKSINLNGNKAAVSLGIKDLNLFPSAKSAHKEIFGCNITLVIKINKKITQKNRCEIKDSVIALLAEYGIPFNKKEGKK